MNIDIILLDTPFGLPCFWWWLFSLGAFLLGLLLHWLLFGRGKDLIIEERTRERDQYHTAATKWEKDFMELKYNYGKLEGEFATLRAALNKCEVDKADLRAHMERLQEGGGTDTASAAAGFVAGAAAGRGLGAESQGSQRHSFGTVIKPHNLQIVEGIGPKIEKLLQASGINNWHDLANADPEKLRQILDEAGPNYRIHDSKSWSRQAQLALEGKWDELVEFQKFLDTGRSDKGDFETPSKVEKMMEKLLGFTKNPEDLKIVEGIGPKIEKLLKNAGINTWADLAATSAERLREILHEAGDRYRLAAPDSWPKQAGLAAEGKWDELSEFQEFLQGGKDPGQ